jgi:hypothetical protein
MNKIIDFLQRTGAAVVFWLWCLAWVLALLLLLLSCGGDVQVEQPTTQLPPAGKSTVVVKDGKERREH